MPGRWLNRPRRARLRPVVESLEGRQLLAFSITEVPIPTTEAVSATTGPDGNLWYVASNGLGRVTASGQVTEFPLAGEPGGPPPKTIASGPDGHLWYAQGPTLNRVSTNGEVTLTVELPPVQKGMFQYSSAPTGLAAGPDGNLWFTVQSTDVIGRVTPDGVVTQFALPTAGREGQYISPTGITAGPDGNLWFTELMANKVGRITPDGVITEFDVPAGFPSSITTGPDGNLWVAGGAVVRVTPSGVATGFSFGRFSHGLLGGKRDPALTTASRIAAGPDGNLWFIGAGDDAQGTNLVARITTGGEVRTFPVDQARRLADVDVGPDGNLWLTDYGSAELVRLQPTYGDLGVAIAAQAPDWSGGSLVYPVTLTVSNAGTTTVTGAEVMLVTPLRSYVQSSSVGVVSHGVALNETRARISDFGPLDPGQSIAITVQVSLADGPQAIQATVAADETETNPGNNRANLTVDSPPTTTPDGPTGPTTPATPVASPPRVAGVTSIRTRKKGLTTIVVRFDQAMDPGAMTSLATYRLTTAPAGKKAKPKKLALRSATFDVVGNAATLTLAKPQKTGRLRLTVLAANARSLAGLAPTADSVTTV